MCLQNKGSQATQVGSHGIEASIIFEIFFTECQLDELSSNGI